MNRDVGNVSVEDVYDLAAQIGKEFECIIDVYGADTVTKLMPKVICTLEHLEVISLSKEEADMLSDELKARIFQLEHENVEKRENRLKFENEIEIMEDNWRKENLLLNDTVAKLRDENARLTMLVEQNGDKLNPGKCAIINNTMLFNCQLR